MKPEIQEGAFYSVSEAAKVLGLGRNTIARHIASGDLKAAKFGTRTWRIRGADLIDWYDRRAAERGKTTEPVQVEMSNRGIWDDDEETD